MTNDLVLNEQLAHHLINERVARAAEPRIHTGSRRHRLAQSMHRWANRLDK
jgi:hypothetical protein